MALALATLGTTTLAGAVLEMQSGPGAAGPVEAVHRFLREPGLVLGGLPFSLSLLWILGSHETGHYLACRRYGVDASLPYFLPMLPFPFPFIGTLGAFIRIRATIPNRNALFDIGAAGPLAGFAAALPVLVLGLLDSEAAAPPSHPDGVLLLGEPLLMRWIAGRIFPGLPPGDSISLSPVAVAGWVGLLATSLNLLPVGQLDGGHICYSVSRRFHAGVSRFGAAAFLVFAVLRSSYLLWAVLLFVLGRRHPPVGAEEPPLSPGRRFLAWICLGVFLVSFIPDPIRILR
ncbi:MAG: site-2 protease family protein [Acidobacteria bacterium]|nr:site-2 protease family protein [Acidobacteriota bacterium]